VLPEEDELEVELVVLPDEEELDVDEPPHWPPLQLQVPSGVRREQGWYVMLTVH
jgi:hypothetical protein